MIRGVVIAGSREGSPGSSILEPQRTGNTRSKPLCSLSVCERRAGQRAQSPFDV